MVSVLIYVFLAAIWLVQFIQEQKPWDAFGAWSSFWGAVFQFFGALFTFIGLLAVLYAIRQLRLSAWVNAQDIIMKPDFVKARTTILQHWDDPQSYIPSVQERIAALLVCRRMDALCRLIEEGYISKNKVFKVWEKPLAKSWIIIEERWHIITNERIICQGHEDKWEPFNRFGREAADRYYPTR